MKTITYSLGRSPDRNKAMIEQLDFAKVTYHRQKAAYGKEQKMEDLVQRGLYDADIYQKSPLKPGKIGVYLSNIDYLEELNKSADSGLHILLEDDAVVPPDVNDELEIAFKKVPQDWDLLYLGCNLNLQYDPTQNSLVQSPYYKNDRLRPVCPRDSLPSIKGTPWLKLGEGCTAGAYAYMVNKQKVAKILDLVKPIKAPIDEEYRQLYGKGELKAYCPDAQPNSDQVYNITFIAESSGANLFCCSTAA